MKWRQVGAGRVQLRLAVGMLKAAYLCNGYDKTDPKRERAELIKFEDRLELIHRNRYTEVRRI